MMTPHLVVSGLFCLTVCTAWTHAQSSSDDVRTIYYDYVEDGELRGGRLFADPADPAWSMVFDPVDHVETGGTWNVTTIVDNGPIDNRINLVIVGDGYTASELPSYANHTTNVLNGFFAEEPLDDYATYFNVHRVDVISAESGVDEPDEGIFVNTALDMTYNCNNIERLLCVNVNKAVAAANSAPAVDQVLGIANASRYGGAGYPFSNLGTLAGANGSAVELALHEFGHSFADLADEYDYGGTTTYTGAEFSESNATIYESDVLDSAGLKWHQWLDAPGVGTFEGCHYHEFGAYRPTVNSKMRSLGPGFDAINIEQFVLYIYQTVNPIDSVEPAEGPVLCPGPRDVLAVDTVQPLDHPLKIQWYLNDSPLAGANLPTLAPATLGLSPGTYDISVEVVDDTARVRDEAARAALMTATAAWTVDICGGCTTIADCADVDGDKIRDDGCVWWACEEGVCADTAVVFGDAGGQFGDCTPDGAADGNDRFHALNCFANVGSAGLYDCEDQIPSPPPAAYRADIGGAFGACAPDGVCDGNDAFAALNAFGDMTSCTCPDGAPAPMLQPLEIDRVQLSLRTATPSVRPGQHIAIEIYADTSASDVRGYQLHVAASGGATGRLELIDIVIDPQERRAAHSRRGNPTKQSAHGFDHDWTAFNRATGQMVAGVDGPGVATPPDMYLATYVFRVSDDATGAFSIDILDHAVAPDYRTFLFPTTAGARIAIDTTPLTLFSR